MRTETIGFVYGEDDENFNHQSYSSREECLRAGFAGLPDASLLYVGDLEKIDMASVVDIHVGNMLENMQDHLCEELCENQSEQVADWIGSISVRDVIKNFCALTGALTQKFCFVSNIRKVTREEFENGEIPK